MPSIDVIIETTPVYITVTPQTNPNIQVKFGAVDSVNGETGVVLINAVPNGGTTGQVLAKNSNTDNDTGWINVSAGGGTWGSITGTLSDQTDLQAALDDKEYTANKQTDLTPSATKYPTVNAVNTGLATILPTQPTFSGQWRGTMHTGLIQSSGSGLFGTAFYTPYFVNKKHTVVAIRCYINTTAAFGYVRLALMHTGVNSDGLIGISTVLEESGNVNTPTSNAFYQYNFITPLELTEQVYWMGFQASGGHTAKFYAGGITPMFSGGALNTYSCIKVVQSFGAFTPSPAVQVVDTGTNRGIFMELLVQ